MENLTRLRIKELMKHLGMNQKQFSSAVGMPSSNLSEILNGKRPLGNGVANNIVFAFENVSKHWLLTGEGSMLRAEAPDPHSRAAAVAHHAPEGSNEGIPLIPFSAMAGALSGEQTAMEYECERYVIPAFKGADFLMPVKGTSMYPRYQSGDIVACRRVSMGDLFFQWNQVYVLDTSQGAIVKRVKPGVDADHILIVSDNAEYDPYQLHLSQIRAVAMVVGIIRLE